MRIVIAILLYFSVLCVILEADWRDDTPGKAQNLAQAPVVVSPPVYEFTGDPERDHNHWYTLTVKKACRYEIRSYGPLDLTVRIFQGARLIAENDDRERRHDRWDYNFYVSVFLEPGEYVIRIRPYPDCGVKGKYQLLVVKEQIP